MKYCEIKIDNTSNIPSGNYHGLSFLTYPKLKFDELKGLLKAKII
jgi:hypothetical protein